MLDFKDVCRAMTVVALIIVMRRAMCIYTGYCLILGSLISFQNRHIWMPKICGFGFGRTVEKFADSDVNSESVTTLVLTQLLAAVLCCQFCKGCISDCCYWYLFALCSDVSQSTSHAEVHDAALSPVSTAHCCYLTK